MVNIGGESSGFRRLSERRERPTIWTMLTRGTLAATMIVAMASLASAGQPTLADNVAVVNSGGGAAVNGPNIGSMETFAAGSKNKQKPLFFNQGTNTGLINATDIKFDIDNQFLVVANSAAALAVATAINFYAVNANSNTGPVLQITPLTDPEMALPDGLAFEQDDDLWIANVLPPHCVASNPCTTTSPDLCGVGSIQQFLAGETTPNQTISANGCSAIDPLNPHIFAPQGMVIDQGVAAICLPTTEGEQGICQTGQTEDTAFITDRIWVVNNGLGAVTVYEPEVINFLGEFSGNEQPPIGGFFPTTTDNLLPPAAGGDSTDVTSPRYIAKDLFPGSAAYITDPTLGFKGRGRIKIFSTTESPFQVCVSESDPCTEFLQIPAITAAFEDSIEGDRTKLDFPQGIAVEPTEISAGAAAPSVASLLDDTVYVANSLSWTIEQFDAGDTGNSKPTVIVRGPTNKKSKLRMINPIGLTIPSVPLPTATATASVSK